MNIVVISGTARPGSYTKKAASLVAAELKDKGIEVDFLDVEKLKLGAPGQSVDGSDAKMIQEKVKGAAGVVVATPEYHGSFAGSLKILIENLGFPSVLGGKPVALLGVAAGVIGAIKSLEQLRGVCSHVGAIVLPGPVSIAGVQKVFDEEGNCLDEKVEARVRGLGTKLLEYLGDHVCPKHTLEQMVREG